MDYESKVNVFVRVQFSIAYCVVRDQCIVSTYYEYQYLRAYVSVS